MAIKMLMNAVIGNGDAIRATNAYHLVEYIALSELAKFELKESRVANAGEEKISTVIFFNPGNETFYNISSKQAGFADKLCRRMGHNRESLAA